MSDLNNKHVFDAVLASTDVHQMDGAMPFVLVPEGYTLSTLEHLLPAPLKTKQTVALCSIESFVAYVTRFKQAETSIFAPDSAYNSPLTARASIDYHGADNPSHTRHFAELTLPLSEQWARWTGINKKWIKQGQFAAFLEQNIVDVTKPDHADIIEVTRSLEAVKSGAFKSGVRLSNGSHELAWSEQVEARVAGGKVQIPEKIEITIPIFKGDVPYAVSAFFRYRVEDGNLVLQIELDRAEFLFETVAGNLLGMIGQQTGAPVYRGSMKA